MELCKHVNTRRRHGTIVLMFLWNGSPEVGPLSSSNVLASAVK